jgi:hypothetical protein
MSERSNEELVRAYVAAHQAHDYEAVGRMRHPDWTQVWPQSGELVRGHANDLAIMEHWPGGLPDAGMVRIVGSEDRWVVTPGMTLQRIVGNGDTWFAAGQSTYPDGSTWYAVVLAELRDGRVLRETWYFGPPFPAPEWRAAWVERIDGV